MTSDMTCPECEGTGIDEEDGLPCDFCDGEGRIDCP